MAAGQQPRMAYDPVYAEWNRPIERVNYGWGNWAYNNPQELGRAAPRPAAAAQAPIPAPPPNPPEWEGYARWVWNPELGRYVKGLQRFGYNPNVGAAVGLRGPVRASRRRSRSRSRGRSASRRRSASRGKRSRRMRVWNEATRRYRSVSRSTSRSGSRRRSRSRSRSAGGRGGR